MLTCLRRKMSVFSARRQRNVGDNNVEHTRFPYILSVSVRFNYTLFM